MKNPVSIDWERILLWAIVVHLLGEQYDWFPSGAILAGYGIVVGIAGMLSLYCWWTIRRNEK